VQARLDLGVHRPDARRFVGRFRRGRRGGGFAIGRGGGDLGIGRGAAGHRRRGRGGGQRDAKKAGQIK
jgi:hypothetical protein